MNQLNKILVQELENYPGFEKGLNDIYNKEQQWVVLELRYNLERSLYGCGPHDKEGGKLRKKAQIMEPLFERIFKLLSINAKEIAIDLKELNKSLSNLDSNFSIYSFPLDLYESKEISEDKRISEDSSSDSGCWSEENIMKSRYTEENINMLKAYQRCFLLLNKEITLENLYSKEAIVVLKGFDAYLFDCDGYTLGTRRKIKLLIDHTENTMRKMEQEIQNNVGFPHALEDIVMEYASIK